MIEGHLKFYKNRFDFFFIFEKSIGSVKLKITLVSPNENFLSGPLPLTLLVTETSLIFNKLF